MQRFEHREAKWAFPFVSYEPQKKEVPKKQVRKIPAKKCKRKRLHKRKHTIK